MAWTFHPNDLDSPDVLALLAHHFAAMRSNSPPDACHVLPAEALRSDEISFWSMRQDGRLLGIGALKQLATDHGEVKSMRTAPDALGRGVGRAMLHHLVAEARRRGYRRLSLETGRTEPFAAALRLYEKEGFVPCKAFAGYRPAPLTRFLSKEI